VLAEFLNVPISELRKGGKYRITGPLPEFVWADDAGKTPAMEAGTADHVWSLEEIIGLLDLANAKI
jgi:hypothetical protein